MAEIINFNKPPENDTFTIKINYLDGTNEEFEASFYGYAMEFEQFVVFVKGDAAAKEPAPPNYMVRQDIIKSIEVKGLDDAG